MWNWLKYQNYSFDIDAIFPPADLWNQEDLNLYTLGNYSNNLPDVIVTDYISFAGNDLAEIYKIPNIVHCIHLYLYLSD